MSFTTAQLRDLRSSASPAAARAIDAALAPRHTPAALLAAGRAPEKAKPVRRGMNTWESQYAALLEARRLAGEVRWFGFEAARLRLADGAWFKPDFMVVLADGSVEFHEIKGYWRPAAKVRLKVAVDRYPFRFVVARKVNGEWQFEQWSEA